jgi:hypothetical protein
MKKLLLLVLFIFVIAALFGCSYVDNTPITTYNGNDEGNSGFNPNNPIFDNAPVTTPTTKGLRDINDPAI